VKVYEVVTEVDDYKSLLAADDSVHESNLLAFDGSSKVGDWTDPLEAELDGLDGLDPDIYSMDAGNLVLTKRSLATLHPKLSSNCEFLPIYWGNENGNLINVIGYVDCLDKQKTEWYIDEDSGKKLYVERYGFVKDRLPNLNLFKIEESSFILLTVDREDGTENLKSIVEENQLTGLRFELLWESK